MTSYLKKTIRRFLEIESPPINVLDYNHVELFYWRPRDGRNNFGDHLSSIIVNKILANNNLSIEEETKSSSRLLALGSIIHFANNNDVLWGSGVNGKIDINEHRYSNLDVRAVRGPLTKAFLEEKGIKVPAVFGDPALLIPTIFKDKFKKDPQKPFVVVPNLHDMNSEQLKNSSNVISPYMSWNKCIEEILKAELVIASSLHGLIIAEAFGIPARYVRLSESESLFKYKDYVLGTGRSDFVFATSVEEAIEMQGMPSCVFNPSKLLDAFPLDLWNPK